MKICTKMCAFLLALLMILSAFSACGAGNSDAGNTERQTDKTGAETAPASENGKETGASESASVPTGGPETGDSSAKVTPEPVAYTVKPAEWSNVEWKQYSNVYFTLTIPKDWEVEWQGNAQQLYWRAYKPGAMLGMSNLDHRYAAKDYNYMAMTGAVDLYLAQGTVRELFETVYKDSTDYFTVKNAVVPANKAQLQAVRPYDPIRDYQSLYAVFSENGVKGEGIYSAVVMESRDVWYGGMNYGLWEINCIYTEWAPEGELVNWQPVMTKIAQSFQYTQYYVQEWCSVLGTVGSPDSPVSDTDQVLQSFEERSTADTILQEKRSDMIGEYERVVDNETGNIYRAYNGFLDDIGSEQTRYSAITDAQYADGFVGWIEK